MLKHHNLLKQLVDSQNIELKWGVLLDSSPPQQSDNFHFDHIRGMMLGLAIGDALGNTTEGLLPHERQQVYGEICDYLPNRYADGSAVGLPSDDSQLAFWTLEQLIEDKGLAVEHLAERFCRQQIFGIGSAMREFLENVRAGQPWHRCGVRSAGNGALMRIAPILLPHVAQPSVELWADAVLTAALTHNDSASTAACVAFVHMLWQLLAMSSTPSPQWWLDAYVAVARSLETGRQYQSRSPRYSEYSGPMWQFVAEQVQKAYQQNLSVIDACNAWYSGAYLMETIPSAFYILMRHADDPEQAIIRAVNDTKDNDTIAAIVGAAVGALHGQDALPDRYLTKLLGRTGEQDDGRVFELLQRAEEIFSRTNS